jgi:hypothetical protein
MTECNPDLHEITMSDEDLERAMRVVYRPDEVMDFLRAGDALPSRRETTAVWQHFLVRMIAARPQTPEIEAAIRVAKRESDSLTVREEIDFVDGAQHLGDCALNDFVL